MFKGRVFYPLIHLLSWLSCFRMKLAVVIIRPETTPWETGTLLEATRLLRMSSGLRLQDVLQHGGRGGGL